MSASNLSHILLCAGSVAEWRSTSVEDWRVRLELLARTAHSGGAAWATLVPSTGGDSGEAEDIRSTLVAHCGGVRYAERVVVLEEGGVTVIVDVGADGKQRIANAVNRLEPSDITEERLAAAISAPAPSEPDLVIVLGKPTELPHSLVWELAYAEMVFFDTQWQALDAEHLEMAINDFTRRDRRFGGVDS